MARVPLGFIGRVKGGPARGGLGRELRFYTDPTLAVAKVVFVASAGAPQQPVPLIPNAGKPRALAADRAGADAFVTVAIGQTGLFNVGDYVPIWNAVQGTVYRVITAITPGTGRLDLDSALGVAFTVANGTMVNAQDMEGYVYGWVDDATDTWLQVKELGSNRLLAPVKVAATAPAIAVGVQEEGALVGTRGTLNFIGGTITAVDNGANNRVDVTVAAGPDSASYVTTAAEAGLSNEKVLGTAVVMAGTIGARPAASIAGRLYFSTDETPPTGYRDNGASWDAIDFKNLTTTRGDLLVRTSAGLTRLALGAAGMALRSDGTDALWQASQVNVQTFTGNGTWTKPTGAGVVPRVVVAIVIGAGGGGGGGAGDVTTAVGGGGGGAGACVVRVLDPSALGATESVTVGAAGGGGASGVSGTGGGSSSLGALVSAFGGGGGAFGPAGFSAGAGGGGGGALGAGASGAVSGAGGAPVPGYTGSVPIDRNGYTGGDKGKNAEHGGGGGGISAYTAGGDGGSSENGAGGGGAGGGQATSPATESAGGAGGTTHSYTLGGGGAAGAANAGVGGNGTARSLTGRCGDGGGGGGGQNAGVGGAGGAGGAPGGGGGGGGGGTTGGGAGGAGARGEVIVWTFF